MALLQISEPGQSSAPHQHRLAVGIDLGTTNSLVATVRSGVAAILADEQGRALLPSIVRYLPDARVEVGYPAQARQAEDPKNTIASAKRFMGRGLKDVAHAEHMAYDFADAPGMVQLRTAAGVKSPVQVSAEILKVLRQLELRETLAGAKQPAALDELLAEVRREQRLLEQGIAQLIDGSKDYAAAAGEVRKLMFLDKLAAQVDLAYDGVE